MDKVGAIILAAGLSRRMGQLNKLLLPVNGTPMIRYVVETYLCAVDGEVCVVTGFEAERIHAVIADLPVRIIHNPAFGQGQPFSVRAGLLAAPLADHLLVGLGDQPHLTHSDLRALIAAHLASDTTKISIPFHETHRGNPIIVPAQMWPQLVADKTNPGCAKFTRTKPEQAQHLGMPQPGFYADIDTPAAFAAFQQTTKKGAHS